MNGGCVASLNLTVNFFSTKNTLFTAGCPALPSHMKTVVCPMEDLQCYVEGLSSEEDKDSGDEPRENQEPDVPFGDEHSHHGLLPVEEDSRIADCEPSIDAFASMEWSRTFGAGELGGSRITESSEVQPVGEEIRTAGCDVQCPIDEFAYMEWSGIHETRELDELRTSPRCSLSLCSDDDGGRIVDCVLRQLSPMSTAGASSFDDGGHLLHERDVVDLVTPVGQLGRKGGKVATICPKIIDLTSSPIIIEL